MLLRSGKVKGETAMTSELSKLMELWLEESRRREQGRQKEETRRDEERRRNEQEWRRKEEEWRRMEEERARRSEVVSRSQTHYALANLLDGALAVKGLGTYAWPARASCNYSCSIF